MLLEITPTSGKKPHFYYAFFFYLKHDFFRVPATSFLEWLRKQGPAEYEKACKAQQTEAPQRWARQPTPPKRKRKSPASQALFASIPEDDDDDDEDETTDTDENVNN